VPLVLPPPTPVKRLLSLPSQAKAVHRAYRRTPAPLRRPDTAARTGMVAAAAWAAITFGALAVALSGWTRVGFGVAAVSAFLAPLLASTRRTRAALWAGGIALSVAAVTSVYKAVLE